jgi:hypothetical protein
MVAVKKMRINQSDDNDNDDDDNRGKRNNTCMHQSFQIVWFVHLIMKLKLILSR